MHAAEAIKCCNPPNGSASINGSARVAQGWVKMQWQGCDGARKHIEPNWGLEVLLHNSVVAQ